MGDSRAYDEKAAMANVLEGAVMMKRAPLGE